MSNFYSKKNSPTFRFFFSWVSTCLGNTPLPTILSFLSFVLSSGSSSLSLGGRPSMRTSLLVTGLSLNRSQCGGCSTKYGTPTDEPESFANDFALQLRHGVDLSNARGGKSAGHLRLLLWLYHRALTRESDARQLRPRAGRCAQSIGALGGVPA